ncbi:DUF7375 domain-containing protein [Pseudomonas baetica]|uniref:DUF7375 domain-containing protein n=1 Tax=Pseudomonas baetica TaxID=674054 RepID=UPI003EF07F41
MTEQCEQLQLDEHGKVKMTRAQLQFFHAFAEQAVRSSLAGMNDPEFVEELIAQADFKDYGKRLGESILSTVSYSDVKAVDKFMNSEQFVNVMDALAVAVDSIPVTQNDVANALFATAVVAASMTPEPEAPVEPESGKEVEEEAPVVGRLHALLHTEKE